MKKFYHTYYCSEHLFFRKSLVYILFLICLLIAGLQEGKAQAPVIVSSTPADGATGVLVGSEIEIVFDKTIRFASSNTIEIRSIGIFPSQNIATSATIVQGRILRISPNSTLRANTRFFVEIPAGILEDLSGNPFPGITFQDPNNIEFRTASTASTDNVNPLVTGVTPSGLPIDSNIEITFTEDIRIVNPEGIKIYRIAGGTNGFLDWIGSVNSANNNVLTLNPDYHLTNGTPHWVTIEWGAITDLAGNSFRGTTSATDITFTVAVGTPTDTGGPSTIAFSPANNSTAPVNTTVNITYAEDIFFANPGVIGDKIDLRRSSDNSSVPANYTISGDELIITPISDLEQSTSYYVFISNNGAIAGLKDLAGNIASGLSQFAYSFQTQSPDVTPPTLVSTTPADNATGVLPSVSLDIELNFDEFVNITSQSLIFLRRTSDDQAVSISKKRIGNRVILEPNVFLGYNTSYYVVFGAGIIEDVAGNPHPGISDKTAFNFTTQSAPDFTDPTITGQSPLDNATDVALDANISITFSEDVEIAFPDGIQLRRSNNSLVASTSSVSNNVLTINPTADLSPSSDYYIFISPSAIDDLAGNGFAGISGNTNYNFTTLADNTPPAITSTNPTDNATGVDRNTNITIQFDEALVVNNSSGISVRRSVDDAVFPSSRPISGSQVTIVPAGLLDEGTEYYIRIEPGALEDLQGNSFPGITDKTTFNFFTQGTLDSTPPTLVRLLPADDATGVDVNANFELVFNEEIMISDASGIELFRASDNVSLTASKTLASTTTVSINPNNVLSAGTDYYILVQNGAIRDKRNNFFAGLTTPIDYNITTRSNDNLAPTIFSTNPADNATNVPVNVIPSAFFSEPIQAGSGGTLYLQKVGTGDVFTYSPGQVTINNRTLTITPPTDLDPNATYAIRLDAGFVEDLAGNDFVGIFDNSTWSFRTAATDNTPPIVTSFNPADNTSNFVATASFNITFNELIQRGSGDLRIYQTTGNQLVETIDASRPTITGGGLSLFINPVNDLLEDTDYYIEIDAGFAQDLAGNNYEGISDQTMWNFRTAAAVDNTPPTLSSTNPANNATNVPVNSNFEFTFSEPIQSGGGTARLKLFSNSSNQRGFTSASPEVTISGNTLTWNPATDLDPATRYFFTLPNAFVRDLAGNNLAGFSNKTTYSFTTAAASDNAAPQVVSRSPNDDAINVPVDVVVTITFDENIVVNNLDDILISNQFGQLIPTSKSISGSTLTIEPNSDLAPGITYRVFITNGTLTDEAGNVFAGLNSPSDFNFTTDFGDVDPPQLQSFTPTGNITPQARILTLTFDEDVRPGNSSVARIRVRRQSDDSDVLNTTFSMADPRVSITGNVVTIDFMGPDWAEDDYYVTIQSGGLEDLNNNQYAGFSATDVWQFSVEDTTPDPVAPQLVSLTPAGGSLDVPFDQVFEIEFDQDISAGNGQVALYKANGSIVTSLNARFGATILNGNTLSFSLDGDLEELTDYYITIGSNAVFDITGVENFVGISDNSTWTFSTQAEPIEVSNLIPADDFTNMSVAQVFQIWFNQSVQFSGVGNIQLREVNGDRVVQTFEAGDLQIFNNSRITINPTMELATSTEYYLYIAPGFIEGTNGEIFGGFTTNSDWNFTTSSTDGIGPTIVSVTPQNGTTGFPVDENIVIVFDEDVFPDVRDVSLRPTGFPSLNFGDAEDGLTINGNVVTIDPKFHLPGNNDIDLIINPAFVQDASGNFNNVQPLYEFTTGASIDVTAPSIVSVSPTGNGVNKDGAALEFSITYDEPVFLFDTNNRIILYRSNGQRVQDIGGPGRISVSPDGRTVIMDYPDNQDLPEDEDFYILLNATSQGNPIIADEGNNGVPAITDTNFWTFSTGGTDNTPPTIVSFSPADDATDVDVNTSFSVTFSEPVRFISGEEIEFWDKNGMRVQNFDPSSSTISGSTISFTPDNPLDQDADYYFSIVDGTIEDLAGNDLVGFDDATTWNFTTEATGTQQDQTITFNPIQNKTFGDAPFTISAAASSGLAVTYSVISGPVSLNGDEVTITGAGTAVITANQAGDNTFNPAPEVTQSFTINRASQTITVDPIADKLITDAAFDVVASTTSNLTLDYAVTGPATISGTTITLDGNTGSVTVTVSQAGNGNFNAASESTTFAVTDPTKQNQTITFGALADKTFGDEAFDLTATASSNLEVSYSSSDLSVATISGSTVTIVGAGTTTITATQDGDATFNVANPVSQTLTVNKADQTITIDPINDKLTTDATFDVVASTTSNLTLDYTVSGPATNSGATITLDGISGTVTVTVSQPGNSNFNAASESTTFNVADPAKTDQTITFDALADKTFGDRPFTLSATSTSNLDVSFEVVSGPVSLNGDEVTITGAGTAVIVANQAGDDTFNPAPEVTQTFEIDKADQIITIAPIADKLTTDNAFVVEANTTSKLTLEYSVSGPATNNGSTVKLTGQKGTVILTVSQAGNDNYNPSSSTESFEVNERKILSLDRKTDISIYPNPVTNTLYLELKNENSFNIKIFDLNGRLVKDKRNVEGKIDVYDLARGTYVLQLIHKTQIYETQIIKNN